MSRIALVGYGAWGTLERLVNGLNQRYSNWVLVDVRYHAVSRYPQWRRASLMRTLGERYIWLPEWGNANRYTDPRTVRIAHFERGWDIVRDLLAQHATVVLMCQCAETRRCHRAVLRDAIREHEPSISIEDATPQ